MSAGAAFGREIDALRVDVHRVAHARSDRVAALRAHLPGRAVAAAGERHIGSRRAGSARSVDHAWLEPYKLLHRGLYVGNIVEFGFLWALDQPIP